MYHLCWGYNRRIQAKHSRNVTFVDFVLNKSKDSTKLYYNFFVQEDYFEAKTQTGFVPTTKTKVSTIYFQHRFVFFPIEQFFHQLFVSNIDL